MFTLLELTFNLHPPAPTGQRQEEESDGQLVGTMGPLEEVGSSQALGWGPLPGLEPPELECMEKDHVEPDHV